MSTIRDLLLRRADDDGTALLFEDRRWSYRDYIRDCTARAHWLLARRRPGPFHLGVLLDNDPEYPLWLGAAALAGAVVVGINPTRRGEDRARDIRHSDCQLLVTGGDYRAELEGLDLGLPPQRILAVEDCDEQLRDYAGAPIPDAAVVPGDIYLLVFTSGTSGAPKACICTHARLARVAGDMVKRCDLGPEDVCYQAMPMFHSNALMAAWAPALAAGAAVALRRRFSASGFIGDVRRFGATYMNYVGKPLAFILATETRPDDTDNRLRLAFGNEATERDRADFAARFSCEVIDGYGSTESGIRLLLDPDTPPTALGRATDGVAVLNTESGAECALARFDGQGRLVNGDEAIGELVNRRGGEIFEGYWNNPEATLARVRDGVYWSGDLAYRDAAGFIYFAGRDSEWLRVDGENIAVAPIERAIARHPQVALASVYAVPDTVVGDAVMAALQLRPGADFDPAGMVAFLQQQSDFGSKWLPRYFRVDEQLPVTPTNKVLKRQLAAEGWQTAAPVWGQLARDGSHVRLGEQQRAAIAAEFEARGRANLLARR